MSCTNSVFLLTVNSHLSNVRSYLLVVRMKSSFSLMDLKRLTEKFTSMNQIGYLLKVVCIVAKMSAFR